MSIIGGNNTLTILQDNIKKCELCDLCKTMPFSPISGIGNTYAKIMLVGEAPGEDESIAEEPFVGQCGRLLDKMLIESGIQRSDIYIANTVNCRPTHDNLGKKNRPPTKQEINTCKTWLFQQINVIQPKVIFSLGKIPTSTILSLKSTITLTDYIGKKFDFQGSTVIPLYHPSFLLQYGKKYTELTIKYLKEGFTLSKEPNHNQTIQSG